MNDIDVYKKHGCEINQCSIGKAASDCDFDTLFQAYIKSNFIYESKYKWLEPYLEIIKDNWERVIRQGTELIQIVTYGDIQSESWASVVNWRYSLTGGMPQHLVSVNSPLGTRAVLLAAQEFVMNDPSSRTLQLWFQKSKKGPNRLFGQMQHALGDMECAIKNHYYLSIPRGREFPLVSSDSSFMITVADQKYWESIKDFISSNSGAVFADAELFSWDDVDFQFVNDIYRKCGLFRYRKTLVCTAGEKILAVAIVNRGPLGMNFSFLENRTDLIVDKEVTGIQRQNILSCLIANARDFYADFETPFMFVSTDDKHDKAYLEVVFKASFLREYSQVIWLRSGYGKFYTFVDEMYEKIAKRSANKVA